jgi:hypothetical protein
MNAMNDDQGTNMEGTNMGNVTATDWTASEGREVAAPLGAATSGRLEFVRGVANVTIAVDPAMGELYRAHFDGPAPEVGVRDGTVSIRYPQFAPFDWLRYGLRSRRQSDHIILNGSIPWQITVRGGAAQLHADLRGLQLRSFEVTGGASQLDLTLPRPADAVPIRITGGASHLAVHRPAGVAAQVSVRGGVSQLTLDDQHLGAVGGGARLRTSDFGSAADGYSVEVAAGVSHLVVDTYAAE